MEEATKLQGGAGTEKSKRFGAGYLEKCGEELRKRKYYQRLTSCTEQ
jgi:hypothetical protein